MSPGGLNEDERRELIARQHRALYGNDSNLYVGDGSSSRQMSQDARVLAGASSGHGSSPLTYDSFGNASSATGDGGAPLPSMAGGQSRSRSNSNASPQPTPGVLPCTSLLSHLRIKPHPLPRVALPQDKAANQVLQVLHQLALDRRPLRASATLHRCHPLLVMAILETGLDRTTVLNAPSLQRPTPPLQALTSKATLGGIRKEDGGLIKCKPRYGDESVKRPYFRMQRSRHFLSFAEFGQRFVLHRFSGFSTDMYGVLCRR